MKGAVYAFLEGRFSTPLTILLTGVLTFVLCFLITKLLSLLPQSKYLIG